MMRAIWYAALALALTSAPLSAKKQEEPPMPGGYDDPGPVPESVLPKIIAKLRTMLVDPYSIRGFTLCAPKKIGPFFASRWHRAHWTVQATFNSKNSLGGYIGTMNFDATFEGGEVTQITQFKGFDLLPRETNEKLLAIPRACPRIPDAEIQRQVEQ